jgi:adenylate kinase
MLQSISLLILLALSLGAADKRVVIVIGPPGSGKTVQSQKISREYKLPIISMAELLKKHTDNRSEFKKGMKGNYATGNMLGDEVANDLIGRRINQKDALNGFILDGYPVTDKQAEYLNQQLAGMNLPQPVVLHINVSDPVAVDRLKKRGRVDDKPEIIEARMKEYHEEFDGILKRYRAPQLVVIDGEKSESDVWKQIQAAMK